MSHLFVSYSRRDNEKVDSIVNFLEKRNIPVWIDRFGIEGGAQWREQIVTAIQQCTVFVLILSPNSIGSDNVRKEIDIAESMKKRIIPVMLEDVELPPQIMYQLIGIQRVDLIGDVGKKINNLIRIVDVYRQQTGLFERPAIQVPKETPAQTAPALPENQKEPVSPVVAALKKFPIGVWVAAGAGGLVLLILVTMLLLGAFSSGSDEKAVAEVPEPTITVTNDISDSDLPETAEATPTALEETEAAAEILPPASTPTENPLPQVSPTERVIGNLAPNPSFEEGDLAPGEWYFIGDPDTILWSTTVTRSGNRSLCRVNIPENVSLEILTKSGIPVVPGEEYLMSVWLRGNFDNEVYISIAGKNADGDWTGAFGTGSLEFVVDEWQRHELEYTVEPQVAEIYPVLGINAPGSSTGRICFDDVVLVKK